MCLVLSVCLSLCLLLQGLLHSSLCGGLNGVALDLLRYKGWVIWAPRKRVKSVNIPTFTLMPFAATVPLFSHSIVLWTNRTPFKEENRQLTELWEKMKVIKKKKRERKIIRWFRLQTETTERFMSSVCTKVKSRFLSDWWNTMLLPKVGCAGLGWC